MNIVARHRETLRGTLALRRIRSRALGISKPYFVYEPPNLRSLRDVPILYLFRGHQREWVNMREDRSRIRSTAIEDLDARIATGTLPPFIAVMPGLASANNHVPSLGINMVGRWGLNVRGLGSGRFWDYLVGELLPMVERQYAAVAGARRFAAGFSLGGYTASLLAIKHPNYFTDIGIYDGLFMWAGHRDPRVEGGGERGEGVRGEGGMDPVWCGSALFDAALGRPRDARALREWNPTDALVSADEVLLASLRRTTFFVASAPSDGKSGNVDRTTNFVRLLRDRQISLSYDKVVLDPEATHSWHWADRFLLRFLSSAYGSTTSVRPRNRA